MAAVLDGADEAHTMTSRATRRARSRHSRITSGARTGERFRPSTTQMNWAHAVLAKAPPVPFGVILPPPWTSI